MFLYEQIKIPAKPIIPFRNKVDVIWPNYFKYLDHTYVFTGKEGIRTKDKCPTAEYARRGPKDEDIRLWLGMDGLVQPD